MPNKPPAKNLDKTPSIPPFQNPYPIIISKSKRLKCWSDWISHVTKHLMMIFEFITKYLRNLSLCDIFQLIYIILTSLYSFRNYSISLFLVANF